MALYEYDDCFVFHCEGKDCSLTAEFSRDPPGSFYAAVDELKARAWLMQREDDGTEWACWRHYCPACRRKMKQENDAKFEELLNRKIELGSRR
jgi:hypothetical protein